MTVINAKTLRNRLAQVIERARKGERFTVLYRSRAAFRIVPPDSDGAVLGDVEDDPLYGAPAVGRSADGLTAADHDQLLYRGSGR